MALELLSSLKLNTHAYCLHIESVIQNDGEIKNDVNYRIQTKWLKLRWISRVFMWQRGTAKVEGNILSECSEIYDVVQDMMLGV